MADRAPAALRVLTGARGANKTWWSLPPGRRRPTSLVVFFGAASGWRVWAAIGGLAGVPCNNLASH